MESGQSASHIKERRRFPRLNATVDIECSVIGKEKDPSIKDKNQVRNISAGGLCLIVYEKVEVGDILSLTVKLPVDDCTIQIKGKIVWIEEFVLTGDKRNRWDVGVEFAEISEDDRKKISGCVFALLR